MTTSSTSCSTSQSARRRRSVGVVPAFWRSKSNSPSTSTSATTNREHLLVDVDSCDPVRHRLLRLGAESVPRRLFRVASYRRASVEDSKTLIYSFNHARSGPNSCSASIAPWLIATLAAPSPPFCPIQDFHSLSRASGPAATSCGIVAKTQPAQQFRRGGRTIHTAGEGRTARLSAGGRKVVAHRSPRIKDERGERH